MRQDTRDMTDPDDSDAALVRAARDGDADALPLLLARHRPVLLALCRRSLGDDALAEDAAQEASLQALLHLDRLRQEDRFGPWLAGIGLNVARMWLRARARDRWSWDALDNASGGHVCGEAGDRDGALRTLHALRLVADSCGHDDPEAHAAASDISASVRAAVAALPRRQRAAVRLFYLSGLSYKETAAVLKIEEGAVRTRLHKARGVLRGRLRALGEEEDLIVYDRQTPEETTVTPDGERETSHTCSFCGKKNEEVHRMIGGPPSLRAIICDECVAVCNRIFAEEEAKTPVQ